MSDCPACGAELTKNTYRGRGPSENWYVEMCKNRETDSEGNLKCNYWSCGYEEDDK